MPVSFLPCLLALAAALPSSSATLVPPSWQERVAASFMAAAETEGRDDDDDVHYTVSNGSIKHKEVRSAFLAATGLRTFGALFHLMPPILPRGFIPNFNDSLGLELTYGAGLVTEHDGFSGQRGLGMLFLIGPRWDIHLTNAWQIFFNLKVGFGWGFKSFIRPSVLPGFAIGTEYRFTEPLALRVEIAYPTGLGLGLGWHW